MFHHLRPWGVVWWIQWLRMMGLTFLEWQALHARRARTWLSRSGTRAVSLTYLKVVNIFLRWLLCGRVEEWWAVIFERGCAGSAIARLGNGRVMKCQVGAYIYRNLFLLDWFWGIKTYLLKFRKPFILCSQKSNLRARENVFELRCEALGHAWKVTSSMCKALTFLDFKSSKVIDDT